MFGSGYLTSRPTAPRAEACRNAITVPRTRSDVKYHISTKSGGTIKTSFSIDARPQSVGGGSALGPRQWTTPSGTRARAARPDDLESRLVSGNSGGARCVQSPVEILAHSRRLREVNEERAEQFAARRLAPRAPRSSVTRTGRAVAIRGRRAAEPRERASDAGATLMGERDGPTPVGTITEPIDLYPGTSL